jgi:hypothetical protein
VSAPGAVGVPGEGLRGEDGRLARPDLDHAARPEVSQEPVVDVRVDGHVHAVDEVESVLARALHREARAELREIRGQDVAQQTEALGVAHLDTDERALLVPESARRAVGGVGNGRVEVAGHDVEAAPSRGLAERLAPGRARAETEAELEAEACEAGREDVDGAQTRVLPSGRRSYDIAGPMRRLRMRPPSPTAIVPAGDGGTP